MHSQESAWSHGVGVACEMNLRQCHQVKRKESKWSGMQFSVAQEKERARHWLPLSSASQEMFASLCALRLVAEKHFCRKIDTARSNVAFFIAPVCGSFRTQASLSLSALLYVGTSAMFVFCCDALSP